MDQATIQGRGRARAILVLAVAVAAVVALAGCEGVPPASTTPSPAVSAGTLEPSGSNVLPVPAGASADASATASAPSSPAASPSPSGSLPAQTAPTATITFNELVVLAATDTAVESGKPTLTFVSDGPGPVSVSVVASAPSDSTKVCLSADGGTPDCVTGVTPAASAYSVSSRSTWTATLESASEASPTIDLAVSWPSRQPSITVAHSPFEGEPNRDSLRSLTATVAARTAGTLSLGATWTPDPLNASLTVWQVGTTGQTQVDEANYGAVKSISPAHATNVKAGSSYRLTLMNLSPAGSAVDLSATLSFP